jgi:creatinine amidohydrolase
VVETIRYADLTWPEVAALPRRTPVLIPIGLMEYDLEHVGGRLRASEVVVMPAVPYGHEARVGDPACELTVGRGLFRRVLRGIQRELLAQGFQRVLFVRGPSVGDAPGPSGVSFLKAPGRSLPAEDARPRKVKPWPSDLARRVVVVSTGHTEQHGHHLPTSTDTDIVEAIATGIAEEIPEETLCLPPWPYGVSTHTRQFPGTLNLGGRVFEDFFLAVVGELVRLGAQMVFFSNAHGGNHSFLVNVVKYAGERWPRTFVATEFLHTTGPALELYRQTARGGMGHGCELETSYMLCLHPELVHMDRATVETDFVATPNYYMDWIEGGRLIANPPWTDDTRSGIYGDATGATAEKGKLWLASAVQEKTALLREVREQHERRSARRTSNQDR